MIFELGLYGNPLRYFGTRRTLFRLQFQASLGVDRLYLYGPQLLSQGTNSLKVIVKQSFEHDVLSVRQSSEVRRVHWFF